MECPIPSHVNFCVEDIIIRTSDSNRPARTKGDTLLVTLDDRYITQEIIHSWQELLDVIVNQHSLHVHLSAVNDSSRM